MCVALGLGQAITVLADMDRDTLTAGKGDKDPAPFHSQDSEEKKKKKGFSDFFSHIDCREKGIKIFHFFTGFARFGKIKELSGGMNPKKNIFAVGFDDNG